MKPAFVQFVLSLTLATAISAQKATERQPKFVLPVGTHALDELIERVVQLRGKSIRIDEATRKVLRGHRLVLHHELQLPPQVFEDVAATLLLQQGVVLARKVSGGHLEALLLGKDGPNLAEIAEPTTVAAVLKRPARAACVNTLVATGGIPAPIAMSFLGTYLAATSTTRRTAVAVEGRKVRMTGLTDQVALGILLLQSISGEAIPNLPKLPDWDRVSAGMHRWPGQLLRRSELIALAGAELGCNLMLTVDDQLDPMIDLGEKAELTGSDWFARLSVVLRAAKMHLVPLVPEHAVFELLCDDGSSGNAVKWPRLLMTSEDVLAQKHVLAVVTSVRTKGSSSDAIMALAPLLVPAKELSVGSMARNHLMLSGPRSVVAEALGIVLDL